MPNITWQESYSVGIKFIDGQHKKLFSILKKLQKEVNSQDSGTLENIIYDLKAYVKFHFNEEEKYLERFNYHEKDVQIAQHNFFKEKINDFHAHYLKDDSKAIGELLDFINYWIINHINVEDKKYSECFKNNGLV